MINFNSNKEKLNIGEINSYSFVYITSINVFNDYKKNIKNNKNKNHTFVKMMEYCKKNNFEFYVYDYFQNKIYDYNKENNNIEISNNFFEDISNRKLLSS